MAYLPQRLVIVGSSGVQGGGEELDGRWEKAT